MREVFAHRDYRILFSAQVIALIGTGLLTVALGLLAYDLAGADGGRVLGIAMTVKMLAYVFAAPVMAAATSRIPRRTVMVAADLVRAAVALALPFVTETWQVYLLVFVLQTASATFTPTFQSVIPDILTRERDYTRALSLSRLAYNLEAIGSPLLAAALLTVITPSGLFVGTVLGFLASAVLVLTAHVPARAEDGEQAPFAQRVTHGVRLFAAAPELRGLFFLYGAVAAGTAMMIINTPVLVRSHLGLGEPEVPLLLAAGGVGEMLVALALPRLLDRRPDRPLMLAGTAVIPVLLGVLALVLSFTTTTLAWPATLALWFGLGMAISAVLTPAGRVIRRSVSAADRPAAFAADFSLSHAWFILTYLTAGVGGAALGMGPIALVLGGIAAVCLVAALVWLRLAPAAPATAPAEDPTAA